jgi:hypothetical protein
MRNTEQQSDHICCTLLCRGTADAAPLLRHRQLCWAKTIFPSQSGIIWLFFIQFYCALSYTEHRWRCSKHKPASSFLRQTLYLLLENRAHSGAQIYRDLNLGILEALPCYEVPRHDGDNPSAGNLKTWKGLEGSTSLVRHCLVFIFLIIFWFLFVVGYVSRPFPLSIILSFSWSFKWFVLFFLIDCTWCA